MIDWTNYLCNYGILHIYFRPIDYLTIGTETINKAFRSTSVISKTTNKIKAGESLTKKVLHNLDRAKNKSKNKISSKFTTFQKLERFFLFGLSIFCPRRKEIYELLYYYLLLCVYAREFTWHCIVIFRKFAVGHRRRVQWFERTYIIFVAEGVNMMSQSHLLAWLPAWSVCRKTAARYVASYLWSAAARHHCSLYFGR